MPVRTITLAMAVALSASAAMAAERVGSTVSADATVSGEGAVGKRMIA
jgi:hypothetical protein